MWSDGGSQEKVEAYKLSSDLNSEYHLVAKSSLRVLAAWESLSDMATREFRSPIVHRFEIVLRAFERDVWSLSEYYMFCAIYQRRHMVDHSVAPMSQVDIRQTIRD